MRDESLSDGVRFDIDSGAVQWTVDARNEIRSSPVVENLVVMFGSVDSTLDAVGAMESDTRWRFQASATSSSSPAIVDGVLFVTTEGDRLIAMDGDEHWNVPGASGRSSPVAIDELVVGSPAASEGIVVIGSGDGTIYGIEASSGDQRWSIDTDGPVESKVTIANGVAYVGSKDGDLYAIGVGSGSLECGQSLGDAIWAASAVTDRAVYVSTIGEAVHALEADRVSHDGRSSGGH